MTTENKRPLRGYALKHQGQDYVVLDEVGWTTSSGHRVSIRTVVPKDPGVLPGETKLFAPGVLISCDEGPYAQKREGKEL